MYRPLIATEQSLSVTYRPCSTFLTSSIYLSTCSCVNCADIAAFDCEVCAICHFEISKTWSCSTIARYPCSLPDFVCGRFPSPLLSLLPWLRHIVYGQLRLASSSVPTAHTASPIPSLAHDSDIAGRQCWPMTRVFIEFRFDKTFAWRVLGSNVASPSAWGCRNTQSFGNIVPPLQRASIYHSQVLSGFMTNSLVPIVTISNSSAYQYCDTTT